MNNKLKMVCLISLLLINRMDTRELNQTVLFEKYGYFLDSNFIDLNGQSIDKIDPFTFNGLKSLEVINLEDNKIRNLNASLFKGLNQLREVNLEANLINSIEENTFDGLSNLELICLNDNPISETAASLELFCNGSKSKCTVKMAEKCIQMSLIEQTVRTIRIHSGAVQSLVGIENSLIASSSRDRKINVWSIESLPIPLIQQKLELKPSVKFLGLALLSGHRLASSCEDGSINVWNLSDGSLIQNLNGHLNQTRALAVLPDGDTLASGSKDTTINIWNSTSGQLLNTFKGHSSEVYSLCFLKNSGLLASGSANEIFIWNVEQKILLKQLRSNFGVVWSLVELDINRLASAHGSHDRTIKIWDFNNGTVVNTLRGHTDWVKSLTVLSNGLNQLASGSFDRSIKIWNFNTGQLINTLHGHLDQVYSLIYLEKGSKLISGSRDSVIKIWNL